MNIENIKKYILFTSILYGIIIMLAMTITYFRMDTKVELNVNEKELNELLDSYSRQAENINDEMCKSTVDDLIEFVRSNNKSEVRNLSDYYYEILDTGENILNYYTRVSNSCPNITTDVLKKYDLQLLYLTASIQNDEILQKYMYQYELSIKNKSVRNISEASLIAVENNIRTKSELAIIKNTIQAVLEVN